MRLILEEKFYKRVKNEFVYDFNILEKGLFVIEINGRAKSWLQNTLKFISFFQDDDLTVKIDGREFPKLSVPLPMLNRSLASRNLFLRLNAKSNFGTGTRLFDSEAAWNGNKLKNLSQINVFCIYLDAGKHTLRFVADQSPLLETIRIYQTADEQNVVFEPIKNYQIENGNRRPSIIFILVDFALEGLKIQASANQKHGDDDDLQLKINGERQINDTPKSHKYWYWCGRILKGQSETFDKKLNLAVGLHYVELWADNTPLVDQIVFKLTEQKPVEGEVGRIALYADIDPEIKTANLRAQSNDKSEILKKIPNGARIVIVKKAVDGNRPDGYLSDLWHEVLYQGIKGFVNSSLIEIRGQEREKIIDLIQTKAKELGMGEKLALNLAHCESRWLPFASSKTDNKGIYQLGKGAIEDINKKYGGDVSDPYDPYQNIDGGLRYFKFLMKRYTGSSDYLTRIIVAWNVGYTDVPVDDTFYLGNYKDPETKRLLHCTLTEKRGENVLKYLKFLFFPLIIGVGLWVFFTSDDYKNLNAEERYAALVAQREISYLAEGENFVSGGLLKAREREVELGYLQTDIDGDQIFEKIIFTFYSPEWFSYYTNIYDPSGEKIIVDGSLWKTFVDDLTGDGVKELIVETIPGHITATNLFFYKNGRLEKIPIYDENGIEARNSVLATSLEIRFGDLDGDGVKEIILPIRNYGNEFIEPTYYYRWNGRGFMLYDKKDIKLR